MAKYNKGSKKSKSKMSKKDKSDDKMDKGKGKMPKWMMMKKKKK